MLATLRKGLTKLETAGYTAGAIVLHPSDWEGVELALSSTNAVEHLSLPYDPASQAAVRCADRGHRERGRRRGPRAGHAMPSCSKPARTVSGCSDRENSSADGISKNLIRARCEGRFGTSVLSPLGVVSCDLTTRGTPGGWLSPSRFSATPPDHARSVRDRRSTKMTSRRICARSGHWAPQNDRRSCLGIKITTCPV